jgi:hypothetical protein
MVFPDYFIWQDVIPLVHFFMVDKSIYEGGIKGGYVFQRKFKLLTF